MGKLNMFKKLVQMNQMDLKRYMTKTLRNTYKEVIVSDGFVYAKGEEIALTAHMDTVHEKTCNQIVIKKEKGKTIIESPQGIGGDDRCGIWMIYQIVANTKLRPTIVLCEDEEIGGVGSNKFTKHEDLVDHLKTMKYILELDRKGNNDAVFYDCGNKKFKEYIERNTEYKEAWGSFSDIGHLSPATDLASVNLSCGYYNQHTLAEYVVFEEMEHTLNVVKELIKIAPITTQFDYQENRFNYGIDWSSYYRSEYGYESMYEEDEYMVMFLQDGKLKTSTCIATNAYEAIGQIVMERLDVKGEDILYVENLDTGEVIEYGDYTETEII